jgi:tetratricopeptide (TPR) repeat protein
MQLIQRMKIWKEMRRLEQRAHDEPSPSTLVDLGQVNINLDMPDKAERLALDGLRLFPRSPELQQLLACARRGLRKRRLAEIRARLVRSPNASLYGELTQLLIEGKDFDGLRRTCQEWTARFPQDAGAWLAMAKGKLASFYQDLTANDGVEAMRCLERANKLDRNGAEGRRLLGELYYRIGAVRRALEQFATLAKSAGDDPELRELHQHVAGLTDRGGDLAQLLGEVEEGGSLAYPAWSAKQAANRADSLEQIRDGLATIAALRGVQKAACISDGKALVKGAIKDGRDPFLKVVRVIAKAAHRFSRRLDFGVVKKTVVDGPFGHLCICIYGELLAAVQCTHEADVDQVLAMLQEIVADTLVATGEPLA